MDAQPPTKRHTGKQQPWRRRCQFVTDINEYFRLSKQDKHYDDPAPFNGCQLHLTPMPLEAKQLEAARQEAARQEAMRQEAVQLEPRPSRGSFTADSNLHDDPVQVGWRDITFKLIPVRGNEELRGTDPEQALESFYHQRRGQRYGQQHQRSEDYHTQHEARGGYGSKGQVHGSYRNQDLSKNYYSGPGQQPKLYSKSRITSTCAFTVWLTYGIDYGMGNDYDDGVNYTGDTCFLQDEPPHLPRANPRSLPARTVSQASSSVSSQHRAAQANCEFSQVRPVSQAPSSLASQQDSRRRAILQAFNPPPIEAPPARQAAPRNGFQTLSSATSSLASANQTIISGNPQTFSPPIEAPPARQAAPQNNFQALSNPSSATSSPALANQIVNGNGSGPGHLSATQTFSRDTGGTSSTISGDSLRQEPRATILIDTSPQSNSTQATAQVANPRGRWMAVREIQLMSREEAEAPRATRSKKQNPITSLI